MSVHPGPGAAVSSPSRPDGDASAPPGGVGRLRAADRLGAAEVLGQLYAALDAHDPDGYAAQFTLDGVSASPRGQHTGRAAIAAFIRGHVAAGHEDGCRHLLSNLVVSPGPAGPVATVEIAKWRVDSPAPAFLVAAAGRAQLAADGAGNWLITRYDLLHR